RPFTSNGTVVRNQATATAAGAPRKALSDAVPGTPEAEPTEVTVVSSPRLDTSTLEVHDEDGGEVRPGDGLVYRVTVHNTGNAPATGVTVRVPVPEPLEAAEALSPGRLEDGAVVFDASGVPELASLAPGTEVPLTWAAR